MSIDISDLSSTVIPKSDQLNADQLITGEMDITVTKVTGGTADQPVIVHYEGDAGRPFKPCKTMRRVLILAWGKDGREWPGRSMRLYHAPEVKFGGSAVGGIRISHMTHIPRDFSVSLSETKGKKVPHTVKVLKTVERDDGMRHILAATTQAELQKAFNAAHRGAEGNPELQARLKKAAGERKAALEKPAGADGKTADQFKADIDAAPDRETAALLLDAALSTLPPEQHDELQQAFDMAWTA